LNEKKIPKGRAVGEYILVDVSTVERVSDGGIVLTGTHGDAIDQSSMLATIVSLGPLAFQDEVLFAKELNITIDLPKIGDLVGIARHSGAEYTINESKFRIIRHQDVTYVFHPDDDVEVGIV